MAHDEQCERRHNSPDCRCAVRAFLKDATPEERDAFNHRFDNEE